MGRGATPVEAPDPTEEREARRRRAREESLEVRPRSDRAYPSFEVRNPIHGTRYRVLAPVGPEGPILLCLCPDFGRRELGTCKHVEAVFAFVAGGGPEAARESRGSGPPADPWERVERAIDSEPPLPWKNLRPRLRSGRELIEPGP